MSHFTTVQINVDELALAAEALQALGLRAEALEPLTAFYGEVIEPDLTVFLKGQPLIGLVARKDRGYDLVADWWLVERQAGITEKQFADAFRQKYSHLKVRRETEQLGYRITNETIDEQGSIRMEVVRWR